MSLQPGARKPTSEEGWPCSFCHRPKREVGKIIYGQNGRVRICNECIGLCLDVLVDQRITLRPVGERTSSTTLYTTVRQDLEQQLGREPLDAEVANNLRARFGSDYIETTPQAGSHRSQGDTAD